MIFHIRHRSEIPNVGLALIKNNLTTEKLQQVRNTIVLFL